MKVLQKMTALGNLSAGSALMPVWEPTRGSSTGRCDFHYVLGPYVAKLPHCVQDSVIGPVSFTVGKMEFRPRPLEFAEYSPMEQRWKTSQITTTDRLSESGHIELSEDPIIKAIVQELTNSEHMVIRDRLITAVAFALAQESNWGKLPTIPEPLRTAIEIVTAGEIGYLSMVCAVTVQTQVEILKDREHCAISFIIRFPSYSADKPKAVASSLHGKLADEISNQMLPPEKRVVRLMCKCCGVRPQTRRSDFCRHCGYCPSCGVLVSRHGTILSDEREGIEIEEHSCNCGRQHLKVKLVQGVIRSAEKLPASENGPAVR